MPTPSEDQLNAWAEGNLPLAESQEVEAYLAKQDGLDSGVTTGLTAQFEDPELASVLQSVKRKGVVRPEESPVEIPEVLGSYRIEGVIARTGMTLVLKGWDEKLARHAALKMLLPELALNTVARERFAREARAMAELQHDHILPIYSVHEGGAPWFAMRYVAGGSIAEALPLGFEQLKKVAFQVASALEKSHVAGLIHRDIKPANILVDDESDRVWLCDFGIARSLVDPALTYSGVIAGSPQYMSPEQARGEELDGRSDLFSLGATLLHAATGKPPHPESSGVVIERLAANQVLNFSVLRKTDSPKWFVNLIERLLAVRQEDRPESASEVIQLLKGEKVRRRLPRLFIILVSVSLLSMGSFFLFKKEANFSISGDSRTFDSLQEAIDKASYGDTILIHGPVITDGLTVHDDKALTFQGTTQAAAFEMTRPDRPVLRLGPSSKISGISFRRSEPGEIALLEVHGEAEILDCRFKNGGLGLVSVTKIAVTNCDFDVPGGSAIQRIKVDDHMGKCQLTLSGVRVKAKHVILSDPYMPSGSLFTKTDECDFEVEEIFGERVQR